MIVSLIGSLISNIIVILVIAFGIYYIYNKKAGNVKDFKETVKSFVEELKESFNGSFKEILATLKKDYEERLTKEREEHNKEMEALKQKMLNKSLSEGKQIETEVEEENKIVTMEDLFKNMEE